MKESFLEPDKLAALLFEVAESDPGPWRVTDHPTGYHNNGLGIVGHDGRTVVAHTSPHNAHAIVRMKNDMPKLIRQLMLLMKES